MHLRQFEAVMKKDQKTSFGPDPRRQLASVADLIESDAGRDLFADFPRERVVAAIRSVLSDLREGLSPGDEAPAGETVMEMVRAYLSRSELDRIRPVVNASGIILHTGLGRAVLPPAATDAIAKLHSCCNLQMDLDNGRRGKRNHMSEQLLAELTGAEAAMLVNNNAGATLLILAALCEGREVIVSRGQLIEIGGSYRLTDCILRSGAEMVEVGTTNKTHLRDYEGALNEETAAVLRVNPSNYRVVGFSQSVSIAELATLKKRRDVLIIDDLGCGALLDMRRFGLPYEPTAPDSIAAGADLVCFSGDKLIGGPQAGIIVGRSDLIERIRRHPLTRMLRVGKLTDAALEATLRLFREPGQLPDRHPLYRMLCADQKDLRRQAMRMRRKIIKATAAVSVRVVEGESAVGGGSFPGTALPSHLLALRDENRSAEELCRALRMHEPPVIARIGGDEVLLDPRTLLPGDENIVCDAVAALAGLD